MVFSQVFRGGGGGGGTLEMGGGGSCPPPPPGFPLMSDQCIIMVQNRYKYFNRLLY